MNFKWLALLPMSLVLLGSPCAAQPYIELRSEDFRLLSDAGESRTRNYLQRFELFESLLAEILGIEDAPPLTVLVLKNEKSISSYREESNPPPTLDQMAGNELLAVNADGSRNPSPEALQALARHLVTRQPAQPWPHWLEQGLSSLFSSTRLSDRKATYGIPVDSHVSFLRDRRLLPLDEMMRMGSESTKNSDQTRARLFQAQSWAFAHFLLFAEEGIYRPQFLQFIQLIASGEQAASALAESFELSPADFDPKLLHYIRQGEFDNAEYRTGTGTHGRDNRIARNLPEKDWEAQVREWLRRSATPVRASQAGSVTASGVPVDSAVPKPAHVSQFELARTRFDEIGDELSDGNEADIAKAFEAVEKALEINPDYAPSQHLFADLALLTKRRLDEAVRAAEKAIQLDPTQDLFRITLAQIHMYRDVYEEAREAIQPVTNSENSTRAEYARHMLENISILESELGSHGNKAGSTTPTASDANCRPSFVDVRRLSHVDGVLSRMECGEEGLIFILESEGRTWRFIDRTPEEPIVFSCTIPLDELQCGEFGHPARIYFDSSDETEGLIPAKAVEIRQ